jgi:hypothetical protein
MGSTRDNDLRDHARDVNRSIIGSYIVLCKLLNPSLQKFFRILSKRFHQGRCQTHLWVGHDDLSRYCIQRDDRRQLALAVIILPELQTSLEDSQPVRRTRVSWKRLRMKYGIHVLAVDEVAKISHNFLLNVNSIVRQCKSENI